MTAECHHLTSHLLSARDVVRRELGEEYDAEIAPYRRLVRRVVEEMCCTVLDVPRIWLAHCRTARLEVNEDHIAVLLAAVVEEMEAREALEEGRR
jgi:hypothetical protein